MTFKYKFKATGNDTGEHIELMFEDGPYEGVSFYYDGMKFADKENEDGSLNMSFDYEITNGKSVDENFGSTLGDLILHILEEQVSKGEAVYTGGTDEGVVGEITSESN